MSFIRLSFINPSTRNCRNATQNRLESIVPRKTQASLLTWPLLHLLILLIIFNQSLMLKKKEPKVKLTTQGDILFPKSYFHLKITWVYIIDLLHKFWFFSCLVHKSAYAIKKVEIDRS